MGCDLQRQAMHPAAPAGRLGVTVCSRGMAEVVDNLLG